MAIRSESYTSANAFPIKLLRYVDRFIKQGLYPVHGQFNICNRCQLSCPYCSCGDRDKKDYIPINMLQTIIKDLSWLGMEAATITGGGEPLLHPDFGKCMEAFYDYGMRLGLTTNGVMINVPPLDLLKSFHWIRISYDGYRKKLPPIRRGLYNLAFSYVFTGDETDLDTPDFQKLLLLARTARINYLRMVTDINSPVQNLPEWLYRRKGVIAQNRQDHQKGAKKCWISLVKPMVDADGMFYPCCGAQYAHRGKRRGYTKGMQMGPLKEYKKHIELQEPFDGSKCVKCYYGQYNDFLDRVVALKQISHANFI